MGTSNQIISDVKANKLKPIYLLMGEESYFIDQILSVIENNVLAVEERDFNQHIVYGRDTSIEEIVALCRRFPMMAEKQVVVVKEAQHLNATIDKLVSYAEKPVGSTVLVLSFKGKNIDKRKKVYKNIQKQGVVFESKRLYENQVPDFINGILASENYQITPKASYLLTSYLGTDLSKISNEIEKLLLNLSKGSNVTPELIEQYIGISKDFNNFELLKAMGEKNLPKAIQIVYYFAHNPKNNPLIVTLSVLNNFFTQLMVYHSLADKSKGNAAKALKVNPYFIGDYVTAAKYYPLKKVTGTLSLLRSADVQSKGVGVGTLSHKDLLQELMVRIMG